MPEPYVELHPDDGVRYEITDATLVRISSHWGRAVVRARISTAQQRGSVFVPMHWSAQFAASGRIDAVVNPVTDPQSGQPELKHTPVSIQPYRPLWHGFILSARALTFDARVSYRVTIRAGTCWRYEIAGDAQPADWAVWVKNLSALADAEWIEYTDSATRHYRSAAIRNGRLQFCLFAGPGHELPARTWLAQLFEEQPLPDKTRLRLLSGRPGAEQPDHGPIICSCFQVGLNTLREAIGQQQLLSAEAIGTALKAGTNCGSCLPELRSLIAQDRSLYQLSQHIA
jgi:assimilatory nitrate reductase catalytic subunit